MSIRINEINGSRTGNQSKQGRSRVRLAFAVRGSDDKSAMALALAGAGYPASTVIDGPNTLVYDSTTTDQIGPGYWVYGFEYAENDSQDQQKLDPGEWRISFDTTAGTYKRYVSNGTTRYGAIAPDFKHLIDVQDNTAQGVELPADDTRLTLHYRYPAGTITSVATRLAHAARFTAAKGTFNDRTFMGKPRGELVFLGATGTAGSNDAPQTDLHFLHSVNVTGMTISGITGINKLGAQFIWPYCKDKVVSGIRIKVPVGIYVEDVYKEGDLATLLGVPL